MCRGWGWGQLLITSKATKIKPQRLIQELCKQFDECTDCRCATLNANDLSSYNMCNNMGFNTRAILNICQLSFHICFQKHVSLRQNFDEWVIVAPKLKMCSAALMCCRKAGVRQGDTKLIPQETSPWPVLCCRINHPAFESPFKMPPCFGRRPRDIPKPLTWCTLGRFQFESHLWNCSRIYARLYCKRREISG